MKPPNLFVKALVVSVFVLLIAGFIAYRSGAFDRFTSETGRPAETAQDTAGKSLPKTTRLSFIDSPPPKTTMMSSSKSMILTDNNFWLDSSIRKIHWKLSTNTIMPSSKSTILADESLWIDSSLLKPFRKLSDYTLTDSGPVKKARIFPKNTLSDSVTNIKYKEPFDVLPGSKSGPLFRPRKKADTLRKLQP